LGVERQFVVVRHRREGRHIVLSLIDGETGSTLPPQEARIHTNNLPDELMGAVTFTATRVPICGQFCEGKGFIISGSYPLEGRGRITIEVEPARVQIRTRVEAVA